MNVSQPNNKSFYLIVASITLLVIPLTVFVLQNQTVFRPFASNAEQTVSATCDSTTGTAVLSVTYNNAQSDKDLNVVAKDLQSAKTAELGTVAKQGSKTVTIDTGLTNLSASGVTFTLTNADNSPGSTTETAQYEALSCPAPTNAFCPASGKNDQGRCTWEPLEGAEGYQVTVKEASSGATIQNVSLPKTASESAFPMTPGVEYVCKVSPVNACGVGEQKASEPKVCSAPPAPAPNACPVDGLPLGFCRWDSVEGASTYKVAIKDGETGAVLQTGTVNAPETSYAFPDDPNKSYQCFVTAANYCAATTPSSASDVSKCVLPTPTPIIITATPTPPPPPTEAPQPTPTPVVVVRTVTNPPQVVQQPGPQTVVQQPGQTKTVQQPAQPEIQQPVVKPIVTTPKPQPTIVPTGSSAGTYLMVGATAILLLVGGLVFFIL